MTRWRDSTCPQKSQTVATFKRGTCRKSHCGYCFKQQTKQMFDTCCQRSGILCGNMYSIQKAVGLQAAGLFVILCVCRQKETGRGILLPLRAEARKVMSTSTNSVKALGNPNEKPGSLESYGAASDDEGVDSGLDCRPSSHSAGGKCTLHSHQSFLSGTRGTAGIYAP